MFGLPIWIIPFKISKQNQYTRNEVKVFVSPASFQYAFWNVPFIGCSLKINLIFINYVILKLDSNYTSGFAGMKE